MLDLAELSATPGSASVPPAAFLIARHSESLEVTKLKRETPEGAELRGQYGALFKRFPRSTLLKVGEEQLSTVRGQASKAPVVEKPVEEARD